MAPRDLATDRPLPASPPESDAPRLGRAEWFLLVSLALIWGSAFLFIKVAVGSFNPFT